MVYLHLHCEPMSSFVVFYGHSVIEKVAVVRLLQRVHLFFVFFYSFSFRILLGHRWQSRIKRAVNLFSFYFRAYARITFKMSSRMVATSVQCTKFQVIKIQWSYAAKPRFDAYEFIEFTVNIIWIPALNSCSWLFFGESRQKMRSIL